MHEIIIKIRIEKKDINEIDANKVVDQAEEFIDTLEAQYPKILISHSIFSNSTQ